MTQSLQKTDALLDPGTLFQNFNVLDEFEREIVKAIPSLNDVQLVDGISRCEELGKSAWRMRAAFAVEVANRAERMTGGRGVKDLEGRGINAALAFVAGKAGVEVRTIIEDRKIAETFGSKTTESAFIRLSRDHFRVALYAPDPHKAIEEAAERIDEPGFSARQFASEIRAQRESVVTSNGNEKPYFLNEIPISRKAHKAMRWLMKHLDKKPGELISDLLLEASEGRENEER
jgi:hypothetical protein